MKDFIIFFRGQEGSSAIISYLQKINHINIIGFEPFDCHHMKKKLIGDDLKKIFNMIFDKSITQNNNQQIKNIYKKYTNIAINDIDKTKSIGFKMRPREINNYIDVIKKNNVVIFVLIRRDISRHAISMCSTNRLQFDLITKKINKNPKQIIDLKMLATNIDICKNVLKHKKILIKSLKKQGINVCPLYYEDFCKDKFTFFKYILNKLDIIMNDQAIIKLVKSNISFQKVHDDDIKKFVINYDEVVNFLKENKLKL